MKTSIQQIALMLIAFTAFTGCNTVQTAQDQLNMVATNYRVNLSKDMLRVSDVYATYLDVAGKPVTEKISSTRWVRTTPPQEIPLQRGISLAFKVKPDSDIPNNSKGFDLKCEVSVNGAEDANYSYTATPIDSKGRNVTKAQVRRFLEEKGKEASYGFTIGLFPLDKTQFGIRWAPELAPQARIIQ